MGPRVFDGIVTGLAGEQGRKKERNLPTVVYLPRGFRQSAFSAESALPVAPSQNLGAVQPGMAAGKEPEGPQGASAAGAPFALLGNC